MCMYRIGDLAKDKEFMHQTWKEIVDVLVQAQPDVTNIVNA